MPTPAKLQPAPGRIAKIVLGLSCGLALQGCQTLPAPAATAADTAAAAKMAAQAAPAIPTDAPAPLRQYGPPPQSMPAPTAVAGTAAPAPAAAPAPSPPSAQGPAQEAAPAPYQAAELLDYFYQLRLMEPAQLASELSRLEAAPANPALRLQLALVLAHSLQVADAQRALALVQEVLASPEPGSVALRPLAHLLSHMLHEQRRLELHNERQSQLLRETQRRAEQLHDRLEAMRAIERSLNRPAPRPGPARSTTP